MGNILVLYDTTTGNAKKMAAIVTDGAERVPGCVVRMKSVDEATKDDVFWCDGIAVGSPTQMGLLSWKMKRFWDERGDDLWGKVDGKFGCAFSTSGGWGGGNELACLSILTVLVNFGFLVFGLPDYVGRQYTMHYGAVVAGEPRTEKEKEACRRLGKRLAEWVVLFKDKGTAPSLAEVHDRA